MTSANGSPSARLSRRTRSTVSAPSTWRTRGGAATKRKSRTLRAGGHALGGELALDRAQPAERLAHRVGGDEPAEALAGVDQALVAQHLERPTDRDPAGAESRRQLGLAGQELPGAELTRLDPVRSSSAICWYRVWRTCPILVYIRLETQAQADHPEPAEREEQPMAVAANTPIELINAVYGRLPERAALGRERLGRPLTFAEKVLINHLRDPQDRSSSAAGPTPTSTPTGSPCRTPPPRWRCSSS